MLCHGLKAVFGRIALLLIIASQFQFVKSLKLLMLDIPSPVTAGETIELVCSYDLEDDRLYSVKWYHNDVEFFRFVPKDWPQAQFLPMPGIRVDLSRSGKNSVVLKNVDIHSDGFYRCEVSAEGPSFPTTESEKEMRVFVLPLRGPEITGVRPKYKIGDRVALNCTSPKSRPATYLRWYINDKEVESEHDTQYTAILHSDGLETASLILRFFAKENRYKPGDVIKVRCTATILTMYRMSTVGYINLIGNNTNLEQLTYSDNLSQVQSSSVAITTNKELHLLRTIIWWQLLSLVATFFT